MMTKESWRERRAARRVRAGDGRPLPRFRWWQLLGRSLLSLELMTPDGLVRYAVDVRQWGDRDDGDVRARLYRGGRQHAVSKLPARFPVEGGVIEVAMGGFGLKRCHFVTEDGAERLLAPDPASAEGRRARLEQEHRGASRIISALATVAVLVGAVLAVLQLVEPITSIPPVRDAIGVVESPIRLPLELNIALGIAAALGSIERALRLRSGWLDNLAN